METNEIAYYIKVMADGEMEVLGPDYEKLETAKELKIVPDVEDLRKIQTQLLYATPCVNGWRWVCTSRGCYRVRC